MKKDANGTVTRYLYDQIIGEILAEYDGRVACPRCRGHGDGAAAGGTGVSPVVIVFFAQPPR